MSANQSPVYAARLAEARKTYDATADKYNALPVPTLEALSVALRTDAWLAAVVYRVAQHQALCDRANQPSTNKAWLRRLAQGN